ncbi:MAG: hypothetical protein GY737_00060 [Desulfobacteraceae bacterium]|nr:hypothetical protein [Desulfobacteraceae bacterium]
MDPNETLYDIIEGIIINSTPLLERASNDLGDWLNEGGALPTWEGLRSVMNRRGAGVYDVYEKGGQDEGGTE